LLGSTPWGDGPRESDGQQVKRVSIGPAKITWFHGYGELNVPKNAIIERYTT